MIYIYIWMDIVKLAVDPSFYWRRKMEKPAGGIIKRVHAPKQAKSYATVPQWIIVMFNTIFFRTCIAHPDSKRNELDRFCIDCFSSFCSNCLSTHACHKHIKIRRYIYSDVINRQDLCKLFNCSGIQTYLTNKAKVLFLKQRNRHHNHQHQKNDSREYRCIICHRRLQDNSLYCSIACKVSAIYADKYRKDEYLSLAKMRKLKQTRKGVPLRAPMF